MQNPLNRFHDAFYAALRIVAGFLFWQHGAQKMLGWFGRDAAAEPLYVLAGVIEFAGGILIALGLFTVPVAFLASGQMAVAYFRSHAPDGFWPIVNRGELAALYCFLFLFIAAHGPGRFSLDALFPRNRPST